MARKYSIAALLSLVFLAAILFYVRSLAPPAIQGPASPALERALSGEAAGVEPAASGAVEVAEVAEAADPEEELPSSLEPALLRGKWLLTGRVVTREARDGLPEQLVPAARVKVYFKHHPNRTTPEEAPPPQTSVTGPDGRFAVVGVPGRLWLRLEVDAETYAYRTMSFKLSDPEWKGHKELGDILIEKGRDIALKIVGPEEEPVVGAEVLVGREKKHRSLTLEKAGIKESRRLATELGDGRYELERGPPGTIRVQVRAAGYSRFREYVDVPEDGPVVIRMRKGLDVAGVVKTAGGEPIANAELEIDGPNVGSPLPTTTTDAEGQFAFDILSDGEHEIKASAEGFASLSIKEITAGVDLVEFVLEKESVLAGTVLAGDDGTPVKGAEVKLRNNTLSDSFSATTDDRGAFEVRRLSAGSYTVSVDHDDFAIFHEVEVEIAAGEEITDQVLKLGRGLTVTGSVLDVDTNEAIPEALVAFRLRSSAAGSASGLSLTKEGETTQDGSYVLRGFIEGDYSVTAKAEDYLPDTSRTVKVGEDAEGDVAITLKRGGDISGRVLNSAGYPVPGASVELVSLPKAPALPGAAVAPGGAGATLTRQAQMQMQLQMQQMSRSFRSSRGSPVKGVVTDEKGGYTIRGIPPGSSYGLMAAHRDFTSALMEEIEVKDRESITNVDLTLRKGGIVRGRILDENGVGIAGAKVRATFQPPAAPDPAQATGPGVAPQAPPTGLKIQMSGSGSESVYSTTDGHYVLTRLTVGTYTVSATLDNRLPGSLKDVQVGEEDVVDDINVTLERGATLAGMVVDDAGEAVPGAEVRASGGSSPRGTTDLEGTFTLEGLPADDVNVQVSKTGYVTESQQLKAPDENIVITLRVAATIVGTVVLQGTGDPVSSANVSLQPAPNAQPPGGPGGFRMSGGLPGARTRPDGTFELREVPPGDYQLVVNHNQYSPATVPVSAVTSGETRELTVELGLGGIIRGVLTGGGGPVVNGEIRVFRSDGQGSVNKSVRTDTDGAFTIQGLPAGEYQLMARASSKSARSFMRRQERVSIADGGTVELSLDLEAAIRVEGTVLSGGQPIGRGNINAFDAGNRPVQSSGRIDSSGWYQIDVPGPGTYVFQIYFPGSSGGRVEIEVPRGGSRVTRDIELPSASIAGVVVDAATGAPIPRARVMAVQDGTELGSVSALRAAMQSSTRTDDQGRFVLGFLTPSTYSIQASADGYAQASKSGVRIDARNPTGGEVTIAMERGAAFQALVQTSGGEPVSGAFALVRDSAGTILQPARPAVSDKIGIMNITGLLPGRYSVSVIHPAYAPGRFDVNVDEGVPQSVFTLERGGKVSVQVVDRKGAAIEGAGIEILDSGGRDVREDAGAALFGGAPKMTDAGGLIVVERIPVGSYRIQATKDGLRSPPEKIDVTTDGTAELRLTLR